MALRTAATPHRDGIEQTVGSLDEGNWRQKCLLAGRNAVIKCGVEISLDAFPVRHVVPAL